MGFLDKIRSFVESGELDKITEKVGQAVNTLLDEQKNAAQYARSAAQTVTQAAPQASAAVSPAKPSRNVTFTFCDSDSNNADIARVQLRQITAQYMPPKATPIMKRATAHSPYSL